MGFDTIYDSVKKFKFLLLSCILMGLSVSIFGQNVTRRTQTDYISELKNNAIELRGNWISSSFDTGDVIPQFQLPGRSGFMVPSVNDIIRILSLVDDNPAQKVLLCGPMAAYFGLVLAAEGIPVWIIEYGNTEREFLKQYKSENPNVPLQISDDADIQSFKAAGPFDVIVISYGISEIPDAFFSQLKPGAAKIIAPLSDGFGSQLLTVYEATEENISISVKGRTSISGKD